MALPALLALGYLAVDVYDRYVEQKNSKQINENDGLSDQEIEDLLEVRTELAKVMVSLWAHSCDTDEEMQAEEDEVTDSLIESLFDDTSLFPADIANQDVIRNELIETFNNPLPMKSILSYAKGDDEFEADLYSQACLIIGADKKIQDSEREFLDTLSKELSISEFDKKKIEKRCFAN